MFETLWQYVKNFDYNLTSILIEAYRPYIPFQQPSFLVAHLVDYTKVIIYSLFLILPLSLLKLLYPYKRSITLLIYVILVVDALSVFGILLAFFQIAFTF